MKQRRKLMTIDTVAALFTKSHDSLAQAVAEGFRGVDKRFEGIDKRFEGMEARLSQQIQGVNNRIDELAFNHATRDEVLLLDKRVSRIESRLGLGLKR